MKITSRNPESRSSLANFKLKAEAVSIQASIHQITGGTMSGCHPVKPEL